MSEWDFSDRYCINHPYDYHTVRILLHPSLPSLTWPQPSAELNLRWHVSYFLLSICLEIFGPGRPDGPPGGQLRGCWHPISLPDRLSAPLVSTKYIRYSRWFSITQAKSLGIMCQARGFSKLWKVNQRGQVLWAMKFWWRTLKIRDMIGNCLPLFFFITWSDEDYKLFKSRKTHFPHRVFCVLWFQSHISRE